jgi:hypothetical protein
VEEDLHSSARACTRACPHLSMPSRLPRISRFCSIASSCEGLEISVGAAALAQAGATAAMALTGYRRACRPTPGTNVTGYSLGTCRPDWRTSTRRRILSAISALAVRNLAAPTI